MRPALPSSCNGAAKLPPGPKWLEELAVCFLGCLTAEEVADLRAFIAVILGGSLTVGTICSGCDSPMLAWAALAAAFSTVLDVSFQVVEFKSNITKHFDKTYTQTKHTTTNTQVVQLYACEKDPKKREFLRGLLPASCILFQDAMQLPHGRCLTDAGGWATVPAVQWMLAGFPCTSMSHLNHRAKHNRLGRSGN